MRVNDKPSRSSRTISGTNSVDIFGTSGTSSEEDSEEDTLSVKSEARCLIKLDISASTRSSSNSSCVGNNGSLKLLDQSNQPIHNNYCRIINPQQISSEKEGGRVSFPLLLELIENSSFGAAPTTSPVANGDDDDTHHSTTGKTGVNSAGGNNTSATSSISSIWCTYQDQDGNTVLIATSEELRYAIKTQGADDILNLDVKIQQVVQDHNKIQDKEEEKNKCRWQKPSPPTLAAPARRDTSSKDKPPPLPLAANARVASSSGHSYGSSPTKTVGMDDYPPHDITFGLWFDERKNHQRINTTNSNRYCHHHHYDFSAAFQHTLSTSLQVMEGRLLTRLQGMEDTIMKKQQEDMKNLKEELLVEAKLLTTPSSSEEEEEGKKEPATAATTPPQTDNLCRKKGLQRATATSSNTNSEDRHEEQAIPSAQAMIVAERPSSPPYLPLVVDHHDTAMNLMEQGIPTTTATASATNVADSEQPTTRPEHASSSLCLGVVASPPPPAEVVLANPNNAMDLQEVTTAECHWVLDGNNNGTTASNSRVNDSTATATATTADSSADALVTSASSTQYYGMSGLKSKIHDLEKDIKMLRDQLKEAKEREDTQKVIHQMSLWDKDMESRKLQDGIADFRRLAIKASRLASDVKRPQENKNDAAATTTRGATDSDRKQPFVFCPLPAIKDPPSGRENSPSKASNSGAATSKDTTSITNTQGSGSSSDMTKRRKLDATSEGSQAKGGDSVLEETTTTPRDDQELLGILSESVIPILKSSIFQKLSHYNDKRDSGLKELKENIECCTNLSEGWNKTILDGLSSQTKSLKNRLNDRTEKIVRRIAQLEACCSDINKNNSKRTLESQMVTDALETMQKEQADLRRDIKILIQAIVKEADKKKKDHSKEDNDNDSCCSLDTDDDGGSRSSSSSNSSSSSSTSASSLGASTSSSSSSSKPSDESVYTSVPGSVTVRSDGSVYASVPGNVTVKSSCPSKHEKLEKETTSDDSDSDSDDNTGDQDDEWKSVADSHDKEKELAEIGTDNDKRATDNGDSGHQKSGAKYMEEELQEADVTLSGDEERRVSRLREGIAFYESKRNKKMVARLKLKIAMICARAGTTAAAAAVAAASSKTKGVPLADDRSTTTTTGFPNEQPSTLEKKRGVGGNVLTRKHTPAPVSRGGGGWQQTPSSRRPSNTGRKRRQLAQAQTARVSGRTGLWKKQETVAMDQDSSNHDGDDDEESIGITSRSSSTRKKVGREVAQLKFESFGGFDKLVLKRVAMDPSDHGSKNHDDDDDDDDDDDSSSFGSVDSLILYGFGDDSEQHHSKAGIWNKKKHVSRYEDDLLNMK